MSDKPLTAPQRFSILTDSSAWKDLAAWVNDHIQDRKNEYFDIDDEEKRQKALLEIQAYSKLWDEILTFIANSSREKTQ